jgi:hypothetical protein
MIFVQNCVLVIWITALGIGYERCEHVQLMYANTCTSFISFGCAEIQIYIYHTVLLNISTTHVYGRIHVKFAFDTFLPI